jgi:hypothetical protein
MYGVRTGEGTQVLCAHTSFTIPFTIAFTSLFTPRRFSGSISCSMTLTHSSIHLLWPGAWPSGALGTRLVADTHHAVAAEHTAIRRGSDSSCGICEGGMCVVRCVFHTIIRICSFLLIYHDFLAPSGRHLGSEGVAAQVSQIGGRNCIWLVKILYSVR